jgi:hypothetical protein
MIRTLHALFAVSLLLGCDDGRALGLHNDAALPEGDDAGGAAVAVLPARFDADDAAWSVPTRAPDGYDALAGAGWASVDLDGDGAIDLVSTSTDGRAVFGATGAPYWDVHRNEGDGFARDAYRWAVPHAPGGGLAAIAGAFWSLVDMDGDARPDLVWTADPDTDEVLGAGGSAHWRVHRNEGAGFAAEPFLWPVPRASDIARGYARTAGQTYALVDVDGDRRPDLVVTASAIDRGIFGRGSSPHWRVHRNLGDGFAPEPASWPVPADHFATIAAVGWALVDWDGDGRVDLVWTQESGQLFGLAESPHWKVFRNEGDGFAAAPANVSIPAPSSLERGFDRVADAGWALVDLDLDRRPDLVWARDPGTGAVHGFGASPHWQVFLNRGDRLDDAPARVAVPGPTELARGFDAVASDRWALLQLDGRGALEIVWTRASSAQRVFGFEASPHWRVFLAVGG